MFQHVLVPLDRSPEAEEALDVAVSIALAADATLELILVREPPSLSELPFPLPIIDRRDDEAYLQGLVRRVSLAGFATITYTIPDGEVAAQICAQSKRSDIDLIVMTSHFRTGVARAWSGSVADEVVREAGRPVLLVRASHRPPAAIMAPVQFQRILVPLDGSPAAAAILPSVRALAKCNRAQVVLLRVVTPPTIPMSALTTPDIISGIGLALSQEHSESFEQNARRALSAATEELDNAAAHLRAAGLANVSWFVERHDSVADGILAFAAAHAIDVIAMCTHGRGVSRLLFGGVADGVIAHSGLPILLQCPARGIGDQPQAATNSEDSQLSGIAS
jgi:nucleotide-binding universal stress UspA family protein